MVTDLFRSDWNKWVLLVTRVFCENLSSPFVYFAAHLSRFPTLPDFRCDGTATGERRVASSESRASLGRLDVWMSGCARDVAAMLYAYLRWMLNNKCARSMKTSRCVRDGWAPLVYCFCGHDHSGKGGGRDYNVSISHDNDEAPGKDYRLSFPYVYEIIWLIDWSSASDGLRISLDWVDYKLSKFKTLSSSYLMN